MKLTIKVETTPKDLPAWDPSPEMVLRKLAAPDGDIELEIAHVLRLFGFDVVSVNTEVAV